MEGGNAAVNAEFEAKMPPEAKRKSEVCNHHPDLNEAVVFYSQNSLNLNTALNAYLRCPYY